MSPSAPSAVYSRLLNPTQVEAELEAAETRGWLGFGWKKPPWKGRQKIFENDCPPQATGARS